MNKSITYPLSGKRKILIIDDNEINREILSTILSDEYECLEATNGEEGLSILYDPNIKVSAVLLDLIMPVCSGIEFLKRIYGESYLSMIPIIVMTAETDESVRRECMQLGAIDFLSKTENPTLVKMRLKNIINLKETASLIGEIETDPLTGSYARQAFFYYAKTLLEEHPDQSYDLLIIDILEFKIINNIYGERAGDALLLSLAGYISNNIKNGLVGRYDSDRFVCLRPSPKLPYTQWFGAVLQRFENETGISGVTLKCGIYENVDRTASVRAMCDRADLALESIKSDFSRKVAFFDGPVSRQQLREKMYALEFEEAFTNGDFIVWYQPKIDPYSGKVVAAEALVRWKRPKGYVSPPSAFLDVFENNGQIIKLDEYVFRSVCMQQKKWLNNGMPLIPISVNLSRRSLTRSNLPALYKKIADETGVPVEAVSIEITESAAVQSVVISEAVEEMHRNGFSIHLDDFGSGKSALNTLVILPIDVVKIDKSLVDKIGDEQGDIILETMMSLAKKLKCHVVAEGVEEKRQLDFLMENHVDEIQGYYYAKPLLIEEFEVFVKTNLKQNDMDEHK